VEQFAMIPLRAARLLFGTRAWRVLIAISAHAGSARTAFPSLRLIAELTGIAVNKLHASIGELEREGLLRRQRSNGGKGNPTVYELVFYDAAGSDHATDETGPAAGPNDAAPNRSRRGSQTGPAAAPNRSRRGFKQVPPRDTEQSQQNEHTNGTESARAIEEEFTRWWELYPPQRRTNRKQALARYRSIIQSKTATPDELIDAVQRYAASDDVARQYACMPTTWLNQERWTLSSQPARRGTGQRRNGLVEAALREVDRDEC
jgi:hypothetical protein